MKYIHYGSQNFIQEYFMPITNKPLFVKPTGGLWASPIDAQYGWAEWCKNNDFREIRKENSFSFELTDDAKVYHVYSVKDLEKLPIQEDDVSKIIGSSSMVYLDFEKISKDYDAIELHLSEEKIEIDHFLNGLYWKLYGWDCDSILIMNPNIIKL